jgi:outer membrane protein OmpA-like peptidoglycan-associated protein
MKKPMIMLAAATFTLSGCVSEPAGQFDNEQVFGTATTENLLVHAAYLRSDRLIQEWQDKFAREVPDTVNFDFNRSVLDAEARAALLRQAAWLKTNRDVRLRVVGHADLVGSTGYNDSLGLRRARAVVRFLVANGVARNRLDAVASRGEREPVVATEERERRNRRAQTLVAGFVSGFVGDGMDGKRALNVYRAYVLDKGQIESIAPAQN